MSVITRIPKLPLIVKVSRLYWWQWGQLLGSAFPVFLWVTSVRHPLLWAVALHLCLDFTAQSTATAQGKVRGDWWTLSYHGFTTGGWPGLLVGGMPGLVVGAVTHSLIDATGKFGLQD